MLPLPVPFPAILTKDSEWTASAGLQYQRVSARDADGDIRREGAIFDEDGHPSSENSTSPELLWRR